MRLIPLLLVLFGSPVLACGPDTDCVVGDRTYRIFVPEGDGPMGAMVFAHGYKGSAAGTIRNENLRRLAGELDMAFVALDAGGDDWQLAHTPSVPGREEALEYPYVDAVLDDLASRIDLDPARLVSTGFSAGGMMTWTLACGMSERFAGFVPLAGTFWAPVPESCPTPPANLVHIHGTEDKMVPLTGRRIAQTSQGNVFEALDLYRAHGGFAAVDEIAAPGEMTCAREASEAGLILDFCTFTGGHKFTVEQLRYGIMRVLGEG